MTILSDALDPPFLSVVIPTWNRSARLRSCVEALFDQDYSPDRWEIVVADDGSTDDTAAVAAALASSAPVGVQHVVGDHGGINAARNTGISAAIGEAVVFLDDDEVAPPSHLRRVAELLRAHPDVEGVGGPYRDAGDSQVPTCQGCALGESRLAPETLSDVGALLGGNMALRRSTLERVGPFDEELSGRGDENEWFARAGGRFLYDPDLYILHRRDDASLLELCRSQFRQGRSLPRSNRKSGADYRPKPQRIPRLLAHSLRRRCGRGVILSARELGATFEFCRLRVGDRQARQSRSRTAGR